MGETTHISWADRTWSPWTGCTKISPACDGCYAAHMMDTRMGRVEWGEPGAGEGTRDLMSDAYWRKPMAWDRTAEKTGVRPWVFPSLCDPFDLAVPATWHARFHNLILETPNVFWLLLTKRIGNVRKIADLGDGHLWSTTNWAIGATFANQPEWDRDYWKLRETAQAFEVMSFGSFEPLLSPIDFLGNWLPDWVIAGGETDQGIHKARAMPPGAYRSLQRQCAAAGRPFHGKQWGEWIDEDQLGWLDPGIEADRCIWRGGSVRLGKHLTGRAIDGVIYDARPVIA